MIHVEWVCTINRKYISSAIVSHPNYRLVAEYERKQPQSEYGGNYCKQDLWKFYWGNIHSSSSGVVTGNPLLASA